jgi:hypothetical protein
MFRRFAVFTIAVATSMAGATTADAKVFRGKTKQGRTMSLVIGSDGLLRVGRVSWRATCRFGRANSKSFFLRPHDESTPDAFRDSGVYRSRDDEGFRLRHKAAIAGRRRGSGTSERWKGTFTDKILVTRRGRYVDTCRVNTSWTARLVR